MRRSNSADLTRALALVTVLVAALLGAVPATPHAGSPTTEGALQPVAALYTPRCWDGASGAECQFIRFSNDQCQDVVVLGARGSGESVLSRHGFGRVVWPGVQAYVTKMGGRRVGLRAVDYPAHPVSQLFWDLALNKRQYFQGLEEGREEALSFLNRRSRVCPRERYVLMGYSQGAMLMHRLMWRIADTNLAGRVDGLVMVGDGDRVPREGGANYGSQPNDNARVAADKGVTWVAPDVGSRHAARRTQVPYLYRRIPARFHSVCNRHDAVCDTHNLLRDHGLSPDAVLRLIHITKVRKRGIAVHESYATNPGPTQNAARAVAARSLRFKAIPPMRIVTTNLLAPLNQPFSHRFTATGGVAPYRFSATDTLPPGLTLDTDGLLHGTVTAPAPDGQSYVFGATARDANNQRVETPPLDSVKLDTYDAGTFTKVHSGWTAGTLSGDGNTVVMTVPWSPTSSSEDLYAWSDATDTLTRLWTGGGTRTAREPVVSDDGRYVVYLEYAWDTDMGNEYGTPTVVRIDRSTGQRQTLLEGHHVSAPALSGDGRYLTFTSPSDTLVTGDDNGHSDIYLSDLATGQITQLTQGNRPSSGSDVSDDGRYVAFSSYATDLVPFESDTERDVFVLDRSTSVILRPSGTEGTSPQLSGDGTRLSWNGGPYAFVLFDLRSGVESYPARDWLTGQSEPGTGRAFMSRDASTLVWTVATDETATMDWRVRLYDTDTAGLLHFPWTGESLAAGVSNNGHRVLFNTPDGLMLWTRR